MQTILAETNRELGRMAARPKASPPVVTFSQKATFHMDGEKIRALHIAPGHTDRDGIAHFVEADVIHADDASFNGFYPFIDVENIAVCDLLYEMAGPGTKIVLGLGPVASRQDIRPQAMPPAVRNRVAAGISNGAVAGGLESRQPLKGLHSAWGDNLIKAPL